MWCFISSVSCINVCRSNWIGIQRRKNRSRTNKQKSKENESYIIGPWKQNLGIKKVKSARHWAPVCISELWWPFSKFLLVTLFIFYWGILTLVSGLQHNLVFVYTFKWLINKVYLTSVTIPSYKTFSSNKKF